MDSKSYLFKFLNKYGKQLGSPNPVIYILFILVSNINKHLAFESILADCQHGFRSQRSCETCETQLVQFYHDIVSNLDGAINRGHKQNDFIIMDFAKAFDKVPHRRLLYKLDYYGIRGSTHRRISSWLSSRSQQVVLDGQVSDPVPALSGVPQGSVLFLVFINDLPDSIRSSVSMFADDCVLYRNICSPSDCLILQDDLDRLAQWEADWQMKFNVAKCHSMRVSRHLPDKQIKFEYHYTSKYWNRFNPPNILVPPSLMILIGVNIFQRYHQKQLGL